MLNSHPQIKWLGEVFHEAHESNESLPSSVQLAKLADQLKGGQCTGIETKFQHLDENGLHLDLESLLNELKRLGFHKWIVLRRRNYLRQAISVARGQITGQWHVATASNKTDYRPFALDVEKISLGGRNRSILKCFDDIDQVYRRTETTFSELGLDALWIEYESDLENEPMVGFKKVIGFLGLSNFSPDVSLQKLESRPIEQVISNFEEVTSALQHSRYAWMCDA
ncbi:MAG: hypothetical protein AAF939_06465 [Planctomycetota bacterium]